MVSAYMKVSTFCITTVSVIMFALTLFSLSYQIIARNLFGVSIRWYQEIAMLAALWVYFAAYALIFKTKSYLIISFFVDRLKLANSCVLQIIVHTIILVFYVTIFICSFQAIKVVLGIKTWILELPTWLTYVPIIVGTFDIALMECLQIISIMKSKRSR